jgi:hypothetical protein
MARKPMRSFVPVPVRVVLHQAEAVGGRQSRDVGFLCVVPLLSGPGQRGFQDVFVADARQPAVFAKLVVP